MEVVYTGPWQKAAGVSNLALQEDVDVVGISSMAGDHMLVPKVIQALKQAGLGHVSVVVGGIVPDADARALGDAGVAHVFHPGSTREEIVGKIAELASTARARAIA
jgi:methylmalonyl-CoA mutase C-terminal domain/subunit